MDRNTLRKFRVAIYGVLVEQGKVLLTDTKVPSGIITNFPGGGLELGEAPLVALAREFTEETRIDVRVRELLFCSREFHQNPEYPTEQLMHIYYRVERSAGEITPDGNGDDVVALSWVAFEELASRRILAVDQEFIQSEAFTRLFLNRLRKNGFVARNSRFW
jgi:ADP-ribose pyrophosphatase YjhB (NUDIX family)